MCLNLRLLQQRMGRPGLGGKGRSGQSRLFHFIHMYSMHISSSEACVVLEHGEQGEDKDPKRDASALSHLPRDLAPPKRQSPASVSKCQRHLSARLPAGT